jgi:hypothetical protein
MDHGRFIYRIILGRKEKTGPTSLLSAISHYSLLEVCRVVSHWAPAFRNLNFSLHAPVPDSGYYNRSLSDFTVTGQLQGSYLRSALKQSSPPDALLSRNPGVMRYGSPACSWDFYSDFFIR